MPGSNIYRKKLNNKFIVKFLFKKIFHSIVEFLKIKILNDGNPPISNFPILKNIIITKFILQRKKTKFLTQIK